MPGAEAAPPEGSTSGSSYDWNRVITLSDGVFAIAITLLVLDLVPSIDGAVTGRELTYQLAALAPKLVAYLLSFLVIGRFWDYHRTFFRYIRVADGRVIWMNITVLLWITLIPASAALLGTHTHEPTALAIYSLNLLLATSSLWLLWRYVASAGYFERTGIHPWTDQYVDRYLGVSSVGFALAIAAALLLPPLALLLVFLTTTLARTVARQILAPHPSTAEDSASGLPKRDADDEAP